MRIRRNALYLTMLLLLVWNVRLFADNPIVQTIYTADPAPMVYKDTMFCYTSHDEDVQGGFFTMKDWRCFSTTDMVNWQDRGAVASLKSFSWSNDNGAWAPQCIHRDGKFYLYCPCHLKGIGVLVADNPDGPFTDAIGKPLLPETGSEIDPSPFVDDDGQAYLYWGNPYCRYVTLNEDMISYSGRINNIERTVESFGPRSEPTEQRPSSYEEGPFLYKRNDIYYLAFAGGPISEHIGYSTSDSPTGPWKYGGVVMEARQRFNAFTNHPGITDFKGNSYIFYHNQELSNDGFQRSVCVERFEYNDDGSILKITATKEGAPQIDSLYPYTRVEAETICWQDGVETGRCDEGGMMVQDISNGDFIKVKGVGFGNVAPEKFEARVASGSGGGNIELRIDSENGQLLGTCRVQGTGGWQEWETVSCEVNGVTGKHDVYLKFTGSGGDLFNFNWWQFVNPVATENTMNRSGRGVAEISVRGKVGRSGATTLQVTVASSGIDNEVTVQLFGVNGRLAATLYSGRVGSGSLSIPVDRTRWQSGGYVVRVLVKGNVVLNKMLLLT